MNIFSLLTGTTLGDTTQQQWYNMNDQYQQSYYGNNNQQISGINNYASPPQTSYYTANQQTGNAYRNGQGYNWQQNNYQQQQ